MSVHSFQGRLDVRGYLRPEPLHYQPCTDWGKCVELAKLMRVHSAELWPQLRRLIVHVRHPHTGEMVVGDMDLEDCLARTWGARLRWP